MASVDGKPIVSSGIVWDDESGAASIDGFWIDTLDRTVIGVHFYSAASGDRAGTITLEGSNIAPASDLGTAVSFVNSSGSLVTSLTVTASTLFNEVINLNRYGPRFLKPVFTYSAGSTGVIKCVVSCKAG